VLQRANRTDRQTPYRYRDYRTTWAAGTSLDLNEARDDMWFGDALASAGPYANNLHIVPDR